ncbi:MAG: phosphoglycerate mutase, partial [Burkholderiales bacterium PBB5]
ALGEDWAAWCDAWRALDSGPLDALLAAGPAARLTLCGERLATTFSPAPQGLWQRVSGLWRKPGALAVLEAL